MKVSELGEFGLIERLTDVLAARGNVEPADRLAVGIGDDAAVWRVGDAAIIATTDTLVEGVHFPSERTPWRDLGWKALAVNVSDIAAMGGTPEFALVTLALPEDAHAEDIDALYLGLAEACEAYHVCIAGGDVVRAPNIIVTVALSGRAELDAKGDPLVMRRDAARVGDLLAVTGCLGGAAGGLRALRGGDDGEAAVALIGRQLRPEARLKAGQAALAIGIRCAIDVSDGLLQDLGHVCRASRLGAAVSLDSLPVDPALAPTFGQEEALRFAVAGGEDYELLFAANSEQIETLSTRIDVPLTVIGEMVSDAAYQAKLVDGSGREVTLPSAGWDHLSGPR